MAVGAVVVVVIVLALLVKGCQSSQAKNSIKSYNADVYRLVTASDTNGETMFKDLQPGNLNTTGISSCRIS